MKYNYLFSIGNKACSVELEDGEVKTLADMEISLIHIIRESTTDNPGAAILKVKKGSAVLEPVAAMSKITKIDSERRRIGNRITELRKERGLTQEELAERCGIMRSNIARIEAGRYSTRLDILARIAEALGVQVDFIEKQ